MYKEGDTIHMTSRKPFVEIESSVFCVGLKLSRRQHPCRTLRGIVAWSIYPRPRYRTGRVARVREIKAWLCRIPLSLIGRPFESGLKLVNDRSIRVNQHREFCCCTPPVYSQETSVVEPSAAGLRLDAFAA